MIVDTNMKYRSCACRVLQMVLNSMSTIIKTFFFLELDFHLIKHMCRYVAVMNSIFSAQRSMVSHQSSYPILVSLRFIGALILLADHYVLLFKCGAFSGFRNWRTLKCAYKYMHQWENSLWP